MANYFVINNKFRPYSFDELIKPYQIYGQAYKEQEAALGDLEAKAATLEAALSQKNDPIAHATYTNYLNQVREAADDIATRGLSTASRNKVRTLTTAFNQNVVPIQAAYNRRKELQDEQRKAMLANPTLYYQRNLNDSTTPEAAYASSIDRFIENPNYDYGNFFSGALLEKQVSDAASILAKELTDYGQGKRLDDYTKTFMQQHGFTRDQVLNAIQNPNSPDAPAVLRAIVDSVVKGSGVAQWGDKNALDAAYASASRGLYSAVGQTSVSPYDDFGAKLTAQKALAAAQNSTVNGVPINPMNIYSPGQLDEAGKNIRKYSQYFTQDAKGDWHLTEEGWKEYNKKPISLRIGTAGGADVKVDSGFREFMGQLTDGKLTTPERAWQHYLESNDPSRWDARRTTEYDYPVRTSAEEQNNLKASIIAAAGELPLREVTYDASTHKWKDTGKTLSTDAFADKKYTVSNIRMSSSGTQIIVQEGGKTYRYDLPRGINPTNEGNRNKALARADEYRDAIVKGNYSSEAELVRLNQLYNEALQSAYSYQSQLGLRYETKPEELHPLSY